MTKANADAEVLLELPDTIEAERLPLRPLRDVTQQPLRRGGVTVHGERGEKGLERRLRVVEVEHVGRLRVERSVF